MNIKFSHNYDKIAGIRKARLLEVLNIRLEDLSNEFLRYDTGGIYTLPSKGDYMMLIFLKINSHPSRVHSDLFTTLRRRTDIKEKYYRRSIGKTFQLAFQGENHDIQFQ